jgi:beta-glucosidase
MRNLAIAHQEAYGLIRNIYKKKNLSPPLVSVAANMQAFLPCSPSLKNRFSTYLRDRLFNFKFLDTLIRNKSLDFIGVNYYTRNLIDVEGWAFKNLVFDVCRKNHHPLKKNSLGWDIYPEGLYNLLLRLRKYNLPVFILENGISTDDDNTRLEFIIAHLKNIHLAMEKGIKVLGYIYWSLIDNFEWDKGFGHRFGLIAVDYNTYKRTIRESAKRFASICKIGRMD